jgi:hypothetical protein
MITQVNTYKDRVQYAMYQCYSKHNHQREHVHLAVCSSLIANHFLLRVLKLFKLAITFLKCLNTSTMHSGIDDACSLTGSSTEEYASALFTHTYTHSILYHALALNKY